MDRVQIDRVLETLTEKQDEALRLASQHLTSKQIANQLGIAPVTVDKRIDSVRAKLDFLPRTDVLRHYRAWKERYGQTIDGPIILTTPDTLSPSTSSQPQEPAYLFGPGQVSSGLPGTIMTGRRATAASSPLTEPRNTRPSMDSPRVPVTMAAASSRSARP